MKKVSFILSMILVLTLLITGCGSQDPIESVKNGSLSEYPNMPIAETFKKAYEKLGVDVTEEWEIAPEDDVKTFKEHGYLSDDDVVVRCVYKAIDESNPHEAYITYTYNQKSQKIAVFTVKANDSDLMTGSNAMEYIDIFFNEVK